MLVTAITSEIIIIGLIYGFTLFTMVRIIMDSTNPSKALGYLLLVIMIPLLGPIIYFSVGVNYRKKKLYSKKLIANKNLIQRVKESIITSTKELQEINKEHLEGQHDMINLLLNDSLEPLSVNNVTLLLNGEKKFPAVLSALENAKESIHIEYYIYDDDGIGRQVKDMLIRKAKEGVKVRFIFDDFGSQGLNRKFFKEMEEAGVESHPFFRVFLPLIASKINYRNHRKIIVVDNQVGFVGGINVSDRYINGNGNKLYWRDMHIKIEGPAVLSLQYHFLGDWNFCAKQNIKPTGSPLLPDAELQKGDSLVQIVASGPDYPRATMMLCYFTAIVNARERIYLTSPYFIPNNSIYDALKKAALSGKDVRLLFPGVSDSKFVNAASRSYYEELLACGARIYLYQKGFIHAKTIIADHNLAIVSTANVDFRSFEFNFEVGAVIYKSHFCKELTEVFMSDLEDSEELSLKSLNERSRIDHILDKAARLFSPLL